MVDINEFVDLKYAKEHIEEEIKEKSVRWIAFLISKMALEKNIGFNPSEFSKETNDNYEKVKQLISGKNQDQVTKIVAKLSEEEKNDFEKVGTYKKKVDDLDFAERGMKDNGEFLELVTEILNDVNIKLENYGKDKSE